MNIQYDKSKIESTLKETSIDDSDLSNVVYLVEDPHTAENFDEISKQIAAKVRMGHKPRSCDALYRSGKYYNLIEVKNRKKADLRKGNEMVELHEKAFDSLGQLAIYLNYQNSLDNLAKETRLVVVYNDGKGAEEATSDIASSKSLDGITQKLKQFSKVTALDSYPLKFKLQRVKGLLYDQVITIDVSDFQTVMNMIYSE